MSVPGLSVLNCSPMSVNAFFNDAAAKTMSFPPPRIKLSELLSVLIHQNSGGIRTTI